MMYNMHHNEIVARVWQVFLFFVLKLSFIFVIGIEQIQAWVKESLRTAPFCTTKNVDWTTENAQHVFSLKDVYTKPSFSRKFRRPFEVTREPMDNLLQLFQDKHLARNGNIRILLQGLFLQFGQAKVERGQIEEVDSLK